MTIKALEKIWTQMIIEIKEFAGLSGSLESGIEKGIEWAIYRNDRHGNINGYVRIPENHKWRQLNDWQRECSAGVEVHGGVTFGITEDGWIGFDTAHYGDYWEGLNLDTLPRNHIETIIWNQQMVVDETKRLAKQIAKKAKKLTVIQDLTERVAKLERQSWMYCVRSHGVSINDL